MILNRGAFLVVAGPQEGKTAISTWRATTATAMYFSENQTKNEALPGFTYNGATVNHKKITAWPLIRPFLFSNWLVNFKDWKIFLDECCFQVSKICIIRRPSINCLSRPSINTTVLNNKSLFKDKSALWLTIRLKIARPLCVCGIAHREFMSIFHTLQFDEIFLYFFSICKSTI